MNVELDPFYGMNDAKKPLRSKVLAVPNFRKQYLQNLRTLAEKDLDWKNLGPVVAQLRQLIEKDVEADTRKLDPFAAFQRATANDPPKESANTGRRGPGMPLRVFAEQRRQYLLNYPEIKNLKS